MTRQRLEALDSFLGDLLFSITSNKEELRDYEMIEDLLNSLGFPEEYVIEIYSECGFSTWKEFYTAKRKNLNSSQVNCCLSRLKGTIGSIQSSIRKFMAGMTERNGELV